MMLEPASVLGDMDALEREVSTKSKAFSICIYGFIAHK